MSPRTGTLVVGLAGVVAAIIFALLTGYLIYEHSWWAFLAIYPTAFFVAVTWASFGLRKEY